MSLSPSHGCVRCSQGHRSARRSAEASPYRPWQLLLIVPGLLLLALVVAPFALFGMLWDALRPRP